MFFYDNLANFHCNNDILIDILSRASCNLSKLFTAFCTMLQNVAHNIGHCLWRQSHNFCNLFVFYTRPPQGNYLFPFLKLSSKNCDLRKPRNMKNLLLTHQMNVADKVCNVMKKTSSSTAIVLARKKSWLLSDRKFCVDWVAVLRLWPIA